MVNTDKEGPVEPELGAEFVKRIEKSERAKKIKFENVDELRKRYSRSTRA